MGYQVSKHSFFNLFMTVWNEVEGQILACQEAVSIFQHILAYVEYQGKLFHVPLAASPDLPTSLSALPINQL